MSSATVPLLAPVPSSGAAAVGRLLVGVGVLEEHPFGEGPGRTGVEIRLQDALDQGGRIYPVESVITGRVWYLTLPEGGVVVREIEG